MSYFYTLFPLSIPFSSSNYICSAQKNDCILGNFHNFRDSWQLQAFSSDIIFGNFKIIHSWIIARYSFIQLQFVSTVASSRLQHCFLASAIKSFLATATSLPRVRNQTHLWSALYRDIIPRSKILSLNFKTPVFVNYCLFKQSCQKWYHDPRF